MFFLINCYIYIIKSKKNKMAERKSILEEAIIQMKNLEEAVSENAKGILASTMRQEIKELVKESLKEQDDEEEVDDMDDDDMEDDDMEEPDMEEPDMEEPDMDDEELDVDVEMGADAYDMGDDDMDDNTFNMTQEPMSKVLKVFKLLDDNDEIEVVSDDNDNIRIKDNETNKEYMIVKESDEDLMGEDTMYEVEIDDNVMPYDESYMNEYDTMEDDDMTTYEESNESYMNEYDTMEDDDMNEDQTIYEIEVDEDDFEETYEGYMNESKKINKGYKPSYKFSKNPNMEGGFDVVKKSANKTMGTGSAKKFKIEPEVNLKGFSEKPKKSTVKKVETKEASRTLGNGKYWGREGLPKPKAAPRHLRVESTSDQEVKLLKEKNEEYRKALNIFRNKLNEVATFNSNLAYATRLFTEHTTSKQEKINILKRFDDVQTIKESKNLYRTIKEELETSKPKQVNESIERQIERVPTNGSAINLIESKTYENPQFLRMKDLMTKMK